MADVMAGPVKGELEARSWDDLVFQSPYLAVEQAKQLLREGGEAVASGGRGDGGV
ncbi:hypothetical protein OOK60_16395 [Trichothermofontia sichuanensis B231]|uniref:hypothetical protein n=1 Tax=Trichothermofontia sichuanensis TaxID=3045816 RepID=UPI002246EDEE|nr:hypothetical protein [Trichothermofontia sichuanensis]UZQ54049.1 hypothetical protein OOK60_16395 [Trichothermofontia sichuanensis B231]